MMKNLLVVMLVFASFASVAEVQLEKLNGNEVKIAIDYEKAIKDFVAGIAIPCKHTTKEDVTCSIKNGKAHAEVTVSISNTCKNYWGTTNDIKKTTINMSTICGGEMFAETLTVNGKDILKRKF